MHACTCDGVLELRSHMTDGSIDRLISIATVLTMVFPIETTSRCTRVQKRKQKNRTDSNETVP